MRQAYHLSDSCADYLISTSPEPVVELPLCVDDRLINLSLSTAAGLLILEQACEYAIPAMSNGIG